MKRSIAFLFLLFAFNSLLAQPYGNEWINYNQNYFKFKITQDGVYKLTYAELSSAGFPVASINPKNIQLFGRGVEIPIHIEGESDNVFNSADFIEFYAQRNDGWFDKEMYDLPANQLNQYYSLINDTATYYITWNTSINNRRLVLENDVAFASYPVESYFLNESTNYHSNEYSVGYEDVFGSTDPEPSEAEGYTGNWFAKNTNFTENLNTKNIYSSGPNAVFKTRVIAVTRETTSGIDDNRIRLSIPSTSYQLFDYPFKGHKTLDYPNLSIPLNQLGATTTSFVYQSVDMFTPNAGNMSVPFATLIYPHTFDMEGATTFNFKLPINTSSSKSTLSFSNFTSSSTVRLYDITNGRRMTAINVSGEYKVVSQNFGIEKKCFLFSDNEIKLIPSSSIKPVTSSQRFTDYFSIGSSSNFIILTSKQFLSKANEYAAYRNTKGYTSLVVDADDLYDQFAFGINKNPLAFRKFSEFVVDKWLQQPKGILIIGKGLEPLAVRNGGNQNVNIIPTLGYPGTDGLLFARVNGLQFVPSIPYGRIAVQNVGEIDNYLNKVKSYEQQTPELWMKQILHFGGGTNAYEQGLIKNNLKTFEDIAEAPYYGAHVTNFFKTTSEPIQITTSDSLKNILETGASILTFYGHAAGSGFDQNIDDPSVYNWGGRYPLIIANSCYIGNIHRLNNTTQSAYNERFVLGQNIGSIGFLAQTGTGILQILAVYSRSLYENFSKTFYGESIGKCYQETVRQIQSNDYYVKAACLEMSLHGDPVIKINTQNKPDYSITAKDVFYTPRNLSTEVDSFEVNLIVSNIGRADDDSLTIEIKRYLPNLVEPKLYIKTVATPNYKDTIVLRLPIDNTNGIGFNDLEVFLDPLAQHDELREDNNQIKVRFFIRSDDVSPVYPYKYAVVPNNTVTLVATTGDPFSAVGSYVMEMDLTDLFNSTFKITKTVTQVGGVVKFDPGITLTDSTVYFWRVSKVPSSGSTYRWKESSFQYIKSKTGWGQAHFFQHKNNNYNFITYDRPNLKLKFSDNKKLISIKTWLHPNTVQQYATEYLIDNNVMDYGSCGASPAILVAIIDPKSLEPWGTRFYNDQTFTWENPNHNFGNANDNNQGQCYRYGVDHRFVFHTSSLSGMIGLKNLIENVVPNGHYIAAYTFNQGDFQSWAEPAVINTFEALGASIATLPNDRAWAFICKKGDVSSAKQLVGNVRDVLIDLKDTLQSDWNFGTVTSEIVGPALRWDEFIWKPKPNEYPNYDSTRAKIIGIKNNGSEVVLFDNILPSVANTSLSNISALVYPLLKLQMYTKDDTSKTPSQLNRWHVLYQEAPESAVAPNLFARRPPINVNEGEPIVFETAIENISSTPMDSLLVTYWMEDKDRNIKTLKTEYLDSLRVGDTLHTSVNFSTNNLPGLNSLWLEVNPKNAATGLYDQLEQYHFNNFALLEINVNPDKTNPILDVTFDGVHIMDGDIVSAKPNIVMQLNDENKYKALSDTSFFAVYLKHPNQELLERLYFNSPSGEIMKFTPATLPANKAKIEYNPTLLIDGVYELQVQGKDASNNKSGDVEYKVKFEVINKSTITQVLNYPNPFSTSTRFVFTLTGSEVPTFMKIQIMTVSGKVIREITESELGPIRIGRNITEYAWDGKDEFGDPIGNGVYLYKVYARINGESIEKRATASDQYFTKGVGKMYLMR